MLEKLYKKIKQGLDKIDSASYDLRPAANKIVAEALARLKDRNKTDQQSAPLILLLGEIHDRPSHHILEMMVIQRLKEKGIKIAVGTEDNHDLQPSNPAQIETHRLSMSMLLTALDEQNISVQFNDAASQNYYLKTTDPLFKNAIEDLCIEPSGTPIDAASAHGMAIRNHIMREKALEHARSQEADIYVQLCGIIHVAGDTQERDPYQHSLSALFKEKACPVLSVLLDSSFIKLPRNHQLTGDELVDDITLPRSSINLDILPSWLAIPKEKYILGKISDASDLKLDLGR